MEPQLVRQEATIVIVGQFNPAIFHPAWFSAQNLISSREANAATVDLVHAEASSFQTDWMQIQVLRDRFLVKTSQEPYYEVLRDLVVGTFGLLNHTPVKMMGINRDFHFRLESEKAWHTLGDYLAPKNEWNGLLNMPGLRGLSMQGKRPDKFTGHILVRVDPLPEPNFGVHVQVNDHYELEPGPREPTTAKELMSILSSNWEQSMQRSLEIAPKIVTMGKSNEDTK